MVWLRLLECFHSKHGARLSFQQPTELTVPLPPLLFPSCQQLLCPHPALLLYLRATLQKSHQGDEGLSLASPPGYARGGVID